jgi:hypothetical protein
MQILITMNEAGLVNVEGPLANEILMRGVLAKALAVLDQHWAAAAQQQQTTIQPAPASFMDRLRNGG